MTSTPTDNNMSRGYNASTTESNENVIWRNSGRRGIFRRHTIQIKELTSQGVVIIGEEKNPPIVTRIPWSSIDNIIVMNQHNTGYGYHYTMGTGYYPTRNYLGFNT